MYWTNETDAKMHVQERERAISAALDDLSTSACSQMIATRQLGAQSIPVPGSAHYLEIRPNKVGQMSIEKTTFNNVHSSVIALSTIRPAVQCSPQQNEANENAIAYFNAQESRLLAIKRHCDTYDQGTTDMTYYKSLVDDHEAHVVDPVHYYACEPTSAQLQVAYNSWWNTREASYASARNAFAVAYGNANRELSTLSKELARVQGARLQFDGSTAGSGIAQIESAHDDFLRQRDRVAVFKLVSQGPYDAQQILNRLQELVSEELLSSTITELDRLRDEYVSKGIPVPIPSEFTTSKSSAKFSFSQLNMGSYPWAILRDTLLTSIDGIASAMEGNTYQVQLNSVYRNPMHPTSTGKSQHQYGTAVDIQVFDFDKSGGPRDEEDWKLLKAVTDTFAPVYTERMAESGVGHVHVDWRGLSLFGETDFSSAGCDHEPAG